MDNDGYSLLLPSGLLEYFSIINVSPSADSIVIYLEEKNNLPPCDQGVCIYESKGFYPPVLVNDFPVRGKKLLLNLRRRRWINKQSGEYFHRDFSIIAQGTRITRICVFFKRYS